MDANQQAVAAALSRYEKALNESDTEAVMQLYAPDGVFMPQHFPSSVGAGAVRRRYEAVFQAITLTVRFEIAEILVIGSDWVMARTNSSGTVRVHATGESSPEANQELFLFKKLDGAWKIARYCFSTTNPPRA